MKRVTAALVCVLLILLFSVGVEGAQYIYCDDWTIASGVDCSSLRCRDGTTPGNDQCAAQSNPIGEAYKCECYNPSDGCQARCVVDCSVCCDNAGVCDSCLTKPRIDDCDCNDECASPFLCRDEPGYGVVCTAHENEARFGSLSCGDGSDNDVDSSTDCQDNWDCGSQLCGYSAATCVDDCSSTGPLGGSGEYGSPTFTTRSGEALYCPSGAGSCTDTNTCREVDATCDAGDNCLQTTCGGSTWWCVDVAGPGDRYWTTSMPCACAGGCSQCGGCDDCLNLAYGTACDCDEECASGICDGGTCKNCVDSDGGQVKGTAGTCEDSSRTYEDNCPDPGFPDRINEYYCNGGASGSCAAATQTCTSPQKCIAVDPSYCADCDGSSIACTNSNCGPGTWGASRFSAGTDSSCCGEVGNNERYDLIPIYGTSSVCCLQSEMDANGGNCIPEFEDYALAIIACSVLFTSYFVIRRF
ncbi:MAG: hypothetical protein ABH879_06185 [archaeon]